MRTPGSMCAARSGRKARSARNDVALAVASGKRSGSHAEATTAMSSSVHGEERSEWYESVKMPIAMARKASSSEKVMVKPYSSDSDDRLAQLAQMQVFFALVASIILNWQQRDGDGDEDDMGGSTIDMLLCVFTFAPLTFAMIILLVEEGLGDLLVPIWRPIQACVESRYHRLVARMQERLEHKHR